MSRKDYAAIAAALREVYDGNPLNHPYREGVAASARALAVVLAADNPNFNRERFLAAALGDR